MQPCSREMQSLTATSAAAQMALHELQNGHPHHHQIPPFDHPAAAAAASDDFLDQMLSTLPSSWPDLDGSNAHKLFNLALSANNKPSDDPNYYDESTLLASRLRQHQISGGGGDKSMAALQLGDRQQPVMLPQIGISPVAAGESGLLPLPLSLGNGGGGGEVDGTFKSPNSTGGAESGLYNGFAGSLQRAAAQAANQQQHFHQLQPQQGFGGAPAGGAGQVAPAAPAAGGVAAPPRQRVRARRGQATDPHSIAERLRRERIAERMKALQELVPNANKTDKASMLDEIIDYVKFLQLQVKVLSMSRLGGAAAVAPLVSDISSEGPAGRGGSGGGGAAAAAASDSLTVTEHQVAKLMEEDMGSAMQYLQGKGLCLMPISLASAISTATCHPRAGPGAGLLHAGNGDGPTSPSMSVLTVQSAVAGGADAGENASRSSVAKDAASVSKP